MEMSRSEAFRLQEQNSGTAITGHPQFDADGALLLQEIFDVRHLYEVPPKDRGKFYYHGDEFHFDHEPVELQVEGSLSRYNHPKFKETYYEIKRRVESIIGKKLLPTYYYDRFYFNNQELSIHVDRPACEISVSLHISSNPQNVEWPFFIFTARNQIQSTVMKPGDGVLYKGCERPHWRQKIERPKKKLFGKDENFWYHQIFFHYVLADGHRVEYEGDKYNVW